MNLAAEAIKASLSMRRIAERYGLEPNRSGYISCPFHDEKTPSLKLYDQPGQGFYCYSCGAGGSVINFVMLLFRITFRQAVVRLSSDFRLNVIGPKPDSRAILRWQQEQFVKHQEAQTRADRLQNLTAEYCRLFLAFKNKKPWSDEWCEALYRLTDLEYLLEELCTPKKTS